MADHYKQGQIEAIDALRSALGPEGFRGFCAGNVIKYVWRHDKKGTPVMDLLKAQEYLDWLVKDLK
jgi:hypothetical protein